MADASGTVRERNEDQQGNPLYDPLQSSKTSQFNQYLAAVIVCLLACSAGTGLAWTSPALPALTDTNSTSSLLTVTKEEGNWIASFLAIGALVGSLPAGILADKIGRKYAAIALGIPFIASWALTATAKSAVVLYVARFIVGISTGGSCVVAPLFISEFAETSIRGLLGTCFQLFLTIGILVVYCVGAATNWVNLSWVCMAIPVVLVAGLFIVPESPYWLLKNGRQTEAATSIKWFWGRHCNAKAAIQSIQNEIDAAGGSGSIRDLLSVQSNRNGFILSLFLMFFQQFSGINAVIFYSEGIFKQAGGNIDPQLCVILVGVVQVVMTFCAAVLVEKAGRKILLVQSSAVMCICLVLLGIYFKLKDDGQDVSNIGWIPLSSVVLFIVSFSLGYGPIPWMMMGELLAPEVKSLASSFSVLFNWISVFVVTNTFPKLIEHFGGAITFWIFGVLMIFGTVFGLKYIFETKGKSSSEIKYILSGNKR